MRIKYLYKTFTELICYFQLSWLKHKSQFRNKIKITLTQHTIGRLLIKTNQNNVNSRLKSPVLIPNTHDKR